MRYMILIQGDERKIETIHQEEGRQIVAAYQKYTEELKKAGVLLAGDPLHQSDRGARITVSGGQAQGGRRAVRRGQGSSRRLLRHPGEVEGRGGRVGLLAARGAHYPDRAFVELREIMELPAWTGTRRDALIGAPVPSPEFRRAASAIWRIESARLVARLARTVRDVDLAEEIAQDGFVEALVQWEATGVPDNPRRLAGDRREAPRHRRLPPGPYGRPQARRAGARGTCRRAGRL